MEYGVYGDLVIIYPEPYSIYLRGTITLNPEAEHKHLNLQGAILDQQLRIAFGRCAADLLPASHTDWHDSSLGLQCSYVKTYAM